MKEGCLLSEVHTKGLTVQSGSGLHLLRGERTAQLKLNCSCVRLTNTARVHVFRARICPPGEKHVLILPKSVKLTHTILILNRLDVPA